MIALARKYRPKRFADLLVQDHVAAALRGAVSQGRPAHGYLFAGPRGVGKTTAARILAMALNCERREAGAGEPCGECDSCRRVWTGAANLDVVELDAASNRGVDDARELRERAMYAASAETRSKVYIVDEAHMLTREAWNALLKILEEPPPRVVFVFATTEPQKIAQAAAPVLSRLQRFDFRRIGPHAIVERLRQVVAAESIAADDEALAVIAHCADGGMRDALSVLDQVLAFGDGPVTAARVRDVLGLIPEDVYGEVLRIIAERDAAAVLPLMDRLMEAGADLHEFVKGAGDVLRAVLLAGLGGEPEGLGDALAAAVRARAAALPPQDIVRLLTVLAESEPVIRLSGQARLAVEVLLLRWAMMDRTVELAQVLGALGVTGSGKGEGGRGTGGGGRAGASAAAAPPVLRDVAAARPPASAPPPPAPPAAPVSPPEPGPLAVDRLRALWPRIVTHARASSPMVATLLAEAEVVAVHGEEVTIAPLQDDAGHRDMLEPKRDTLARIVGAWVAGPLRVRIGSAARHGATAPARPARLTPREAEAERLKVLRGKDATLSAAVDALDLELLE
jgi:DNA polymerase-3 subunit gamma/tau